MNFTKYIKLKYLISGFRILFYKARYLNHLKIKGIKHYIGKDSTINISNNGKILLEGAYLSKNTDFIADGGNITIGKDTFFNKNNLVVSRANINIGRDCLFGDNVSIYDHDHNFIDSYKPIGKQGFNSEDIIIGNNVWVGSKSTILKGVTIGDNSIIGANALVIKDIPPNCIAIGSPAKVLKTRD